MAAFFYGGAHLLWYWQTPFGTAPVLDEKENLALALQIASGELPPEPFYRAMGYPLVLASFLSLGIPAATLPLAATAFGLLLHVLNSTLVATIASRLFRLRVAGLLAGLLHALNPSLIHYATQILDGTFANAFFLLGLASVVRVDVSTDEDSKASPIIAALSWSLAALIRPQFLSLLVLFPLVWWLARPVPLRRLPIVIAPALLIALLPWLAQGIAQWRIGGAFRLMPTQGSYNLWAANRPGADGRYFTQSVRIRAGNDHINPAKVESRLLFEHETGRTISSIDEENAHWGNRLRQAILAEPAAWLRLTARKAYYLLNDFDAYNNKTYAFHQARSPWLAPNPLSWGLILSLAVLGSATLIRRKPRTAATIALIGLTVAAGIVITFVSGRFRLPLTTLLCLLTGGLAGLRGLPPRIFALGACAAITFAGLSFSRFFDSHDTRTFLQDNLLLAASATEAGDDTTAWNASGEALTLSPGHPDALAWRVGAGFNLLVADQLSSAQSVEWTEASRALIRTLPASSHPPSIIALAGLALWRNGDREQAAALWRHRWTQYHEPASRAALLLAGESPDTPPGDQPTAAADSLSVILAARDTQVPDETSVRLRQLANRLFERP